MKKLMFAAVAAAIVGSASAVTVYDYRATVKHPYLKEVSVRPAGGGAAIKVYAKFIKSSTIKGYLIQDEEAVLNGGIKAAGAGNAWITGRNTVAQPENRCFLVAINSGAGKYAYPRIIPGIIEAKWYNPACAAFARNGQTVPAQGYLWLGGEVVAPDAGLLSVGGAGVPTDPATPYLVVGHKNAAIAYPAALVASPGTAVANTLPVAINSTFAAEVWNYAFTSEYLFGQYNQKAGSAIAYADTWLNGAGFGTAGAYDDRDACCGWGTGSAGVGVSSLQGNLKGGIYICTENGDDKNHAHPFGGLNLAGNGVSPFAPSQYERQLWATIDRIATPVPVTIETGIFATGTQARYDDLWVDGPLLLRTTDCVSGTWSIRRVTRDMTAALATAAGGEEAVFATVATVTAYCGLAANPPAAFLVPSYDRAGSPVDSFDGTLELLETIKGCMKALNRNARMAGTDAAAAPSNSKVPEALFGPTFYNSYLAQ